VVRFVCRTAATRRIDLLVEPEFERIFENGTPDSYFVNTNQTFVESPRLRWARRRADA
jgi:hypothetical protein